MKIHYTITIGTKDIHIEDEAASQKEVFEKVSPYHAMEMIASEKQNVYISFRTTKSGDSYYSLICTDDHTEYSFGALKDGSGKLFPGKYDKAKQTTVRGWNKIQYGE